MSIDVGDRVREFAQKTDENNGRIGQQGEVIDIRVVRVVRGLRCQVRVAKVRFMCDDAELWIETRYLRKLNAIDALGKLVSDE